MLIKEFIVALHLFISISGLYFISSTSKSKNENYTFMGKNISSKNIEIFAIYLILFMAFLVTLLNFNIFIYLYRFSKTTDWGFYMITTLLMTAMFLIVVKYYINKNIKFFSRVSKQDYAKLNKIISNEKKVNSIKINKNIRYWKYNQIEGVYHDK